MRAVHLPALDRSVSLGAYVSAVRRAKASPTTEFRQGLDCWWPATGAQIMRQFRRAMHRRISEAVPYIARGAPSRTPKVVQPIRDDQKVNAQ